MEKTEKVKYFTDKELKKFFKTLDNEKLIASSPMSKMLAIRNEAMFKIMYYCALRATETTLIKKDYYNHLSNEIYCKRLKGGKNNTLRILDEKVLRSLNRHLKYNNDSEYLFENFQLKKELSRKTLDHLMKKYCELADISDREKWHCHTLRHTRAIYLAENGFDLKELQYWLGHSHVSNTLIYFQFTSRQQDILYKKLEKPWKNSKIN